ncbi:glutathione S-transferase family protein [Nitrogeniibacter mangrovi]|uniref:Glutathione S-transferase family protein n=1 Tax=Nitrogeniibacter mangrovi TaxID=2016596 RepID=A0A6C1B1I9_9RHOO|nr:glutathione S-transferase family protein [Nitrogeniibacter mangrovi]QID16849.1 glutathione S-transferase family protein [Nitrogeniibacter mangrovi]
MLTVYGCPNSRSMRMVWALEEAGAEYAYILIDLFRGAGRSPDFLRINPAGKVPALVEDGTALTESGAILMWLADKYPHARLIPGTDEPRARADVLQWLMFGLTELEPPLWTIAKHRFVLPESRRVPQIEETSKWEFASACALLARHLGQKPYVAGNRFSIADIVITHCLAWAQSARIEIVPALLVDYMEHHWHRPAARRAIEREARPAQ